MPIYLFLALLALIITGCATEPEVSPEHPEARVGFTAISDGANGGNPHFYFLPPLVKRPEYTGVFDPDAAATLEICPWSEGTCAGSGPSFTRTEAGEFRLKVDLEGEHYLAVWNPTDSEHARGGIYRLIVILEGRTLGHLDLEVKARRSYPIAFRIEEGAAEGLLESRGLQFDQPVLHVNPEDPIALTYPVEDGELVQVITRKDTDGTPIALSGWRRFSPSEPANADIVELDERLYPARVYLRYGGQVAYEFLEGNQVRMKVTAPDGTSGEVTFSFTPRSTGLSAALSTTRSLAGVSSAVALTVRTTMVEGGIHPVDGAHVTGNWELDDPIENLQVGFFSTRPVGSGKYEAMIPMGPVEPSALENVLENSCSSSAVEFLESFCDQMNGLDGPFFQMAGLACLQLVNPVLVAICSAGVAVTAVGCEYPICDAIKMYYDAFPSNPIRVTVTSRLRDVPWRRTDSKIVALPSQAVDFQFELPYPKFSITPPEATGTLGEIPNPDPLYPGSFIGWLTCPGPTLEVSGQAALEFVTVTGYAYNQIYPPPDPQTADGGILFAQRSALYSGDAIGLWAGENYYLAFLPLPPSTRIPWGLVVHTTFTVEETGRKGNSNVIFLCQ